MINKFSLGRCRQAGRTTVVVASFLLLWVSAMGSWAASGVTPIASKDPAASVAASVAENSAGELLQQRLRGLERYKANFTQVIEGGRGQIVERSQGRVVLSRPNFHWQVADPFPQHIVSTKDQLWVYDPDLEQVIIKPLSNALQDTPIALLTDQALVLGDNFRIEHRAPGAEIDATDIFVLTPTQAESLYGEIRLQFAGSALTQLGILDHLGQYTLIRFSEVERPAVVDSAEFILDLPPTIDVIEG